MLPLKSASDLEVFRKEILSKRDPDKQSVAVCASSCETRGGKEVVVAFQNEIKKQGLEGKVDIRGTGCLGLCEQGPIVIVYPQAVPYFKVKDSDVPSIVSETLVKKELIQKLLYIDPETGKRATKLLDIPFYKYQNRLLLETNAIVDPKKIDDYIAIGGYKALGKVLSSMTPEQVMDEVKKSKTSRQRRRRLPNWSQMGNNAQCV